MKNGTFKRAVLVTGCSSGIGRAVAIHLATAGFSVFATVRKVKDQRALEALELRSLKVLCPLDMTDEQQIDAAFSRLTETLEGRESELYAVVSNAGAGAPAPVELIAPLMMRTELLARVVGPIVLLQRALPLLRRSHGRIVWITTPATIPTPYVASIHACDFAVNCLARTLEIELAQWGIPNVMIRCGGIRTPAGMRTQNDVERLLRGTGEERLALYGSQLRQWADDMAQFDERRTEPERVAETVLRALTVPRPRRRYAVGHMAHLAAFLEALPQPLADSILKRRF